MSTMVETVLGAFETDPDGASVLVDEAVGNWLHDTAELYEPYLQGVLATQVATATAVAKRQLARSYVELMVEGSYPDDEVHKTAEWLAGIDRFTQAVLDQTQEVSKYGLRTETWYLNDGSQVRRQVNRDHSGRFTRFVDTSASSNVLGVADTARISPLLRGRSVQVTGRGPAWAEDVDEPMKAQANRHQAQWEQASRYAAELATAYNGSKQTTDGVVLQLQVMGSDNKQRLEEVPIRAARNGLPLIATINPFEDTLLSLTVAAKDGADEQTRAAVARFNTMGAVGDTTLARYGTVPGSAWSDALRRYDVSESGSDVLFGRLRGAGQVLSAVPGGEKAGHFAALVGQMGPEAEKVLGPYLRQAAYRYRGTEKTPDAALREQYASQERALLAHLANDENPQTKDGRPLTASEAAALALPGEKRRSGEVTHTPLTGAAKRRIALGAQGDRLELQVDADVATAHLIHTLPERSITAELSERSGHVLPSQGVLLDGKGQLVSQAVGYADDHYLPFDLKNLAALRGGQYVRTRVQGGLTGEDVYAAVQSGARMVTVVSSSGVYSLELDPTFRGARGNSDKARQMYSRYLKILDAVDASDLYLNDLSGPEKAQVRERTRLLNPGLDGDDYDKAEKKALNDARRDKTMLGQDALDELWATAQSQAQAELKGGSGSRQELGRRTTDIYDELVDAEKAKSVQRLALNGQGYKVALETLQQQFPYFIRGVSYESLPDFLANRDLRVTSGSVRTREGAKDRGYVAPGGLRPRTVQSGYYRPGGPDVAPKPHPGEETTAGSAGVSGGAPEPTAAGAGGGERPGPSAPAATMRSNLAAKMTLLSTVADTQTKEAAAALTNALGTLTVYANQAQGKTWDEVKGSGNTVIQNQVLLEQPAAKLVELIKTDPAAQTALRDTAALKSAFANVYGVGLDDEIASWPESKKAAFGDATNSTEIADWVSNQAQRVADAASMTEPFSQPYTPEMLYYAPQKPYEFPEYGQIGTPDQYKALTSSGQGRNTKELADLLFPPSKRGEYPSSGEVQVAVASAIDVLKKAKDALGPAASLARDSGKMEDYSADTLARLAGVSRADLEKVMGGTLAMGAGTAAALDRRAEEIQRAWALRTVERSLQLLHGGPEGGPGDVHPKPGAGLFLPAKVEKASSSRRVRVAKTCEDVTIRVALARAR